MKRILSIVLCSVLTYSSLAQLTQGSVASANAPGGRIYFYQYKPPQYNNTDLFPLIVSLHGGGEGGDANGSNLANVLSYGLPQLVSKGQVLQSTWNGVTEGFIMLAPQTTAALTNSWPSYYVDEMINYGIANLRVDPNRVFLTGYSLGGAGVWNYATSSPTAAARLAGLIPAAATPAGGNFCNIAGSQVATWVQHSLYDQFGNVQQAIDYTNAVNACNPLIVPAVDTIYPTGSHDIYMTKTYDPTNNSHYPNLFQWMQRVKRTLNPATNQNPVPVIAGPAVVNLTAPLNKRNFPVLDGTGSFDNDDIIMDYYWEQTSGPAVMLPVPTAVNDVVNDERRQRPLVVIPPTPNNYGVPIGTYTFRLRVKDYLTSKPGHTQFATKTVNVVLPPSGVAGPVADAGDDIFLSGTSTTAQRSGAFESTYGGTGPINYNWTFISGPQTAVLRTFNYSAPYTSGDNNVGFTNMNAPGTYTFEFSVSNSNGVGTDRVNVIKLSALPVSYAYITGKNNGTSNTVSWATTDEVNSLRFDVQRSADGTNFSTIGSVTAKGSASAYSFDDANAPLGVSYYRLAQVDKDGTTTLSKTVTINNSTAGLFIQKYPNPVHDNLTVAVQSTTNGKLTMIIADMQGKTIMQQQWQKDQPLLRKVINVGALQNGVYQMIIESGAEKRISSFVKY